MTADCMSKTQKAQYYNVVDVLASCYVVGRLLLTSQTQKEIHLQVSCLHCPALLHALTA